MSRKKELPIPPKVKDDAAEVLRVWITPDKGMEVTLATAFKDPVAWGVVLANVAHHVARAYVDEGRGDAVEIARAIREGLVSTWSNPTESGATERLKK